MHVITVTRTTTAESWAIWELWADVPNRTRWDESLEHVTLEGAFRSGATGTVKLKGLPERKFEVLDCEPPQAYTDRFFLPLGGTMEWAHTIRQVHDGCELTFDVNVTGLTSPLLGLILKRILRRELPPTVDKLTRLAESKRAAE